MSAEENGREPNPTDSSLFLRKQPSEYGVRKRKEYILTSHLINLNPASYLVSNSPSPATPARTKSTICMGLCGAVHCAVS